MMTETMKIVLDMLRTEHEGDPGQGHLTMDNWEWPTGVALYGIWKTYEQLGDEEALQYLRVWYERRLRMEPPHRNVNTVAPMLALTCLYEQDRNPAWLPHILSWVDWVMKEMPRTEFDGLQHCTVWNKHYQQLWADTLFMTALFLCKAGLVLHRPDWVEEAKYQFLLHIRYLQDKVTGLWYHGWTFDLRHNFARAFWARGNAWFTAAFVELADMLGIQDASMRLIHAAWCDQIRGLWKMQRENGLFTTLLDVEETYCETSATAAIAFGVRKGIRLGLLEEQYSKMGNAAAKAVMGKIAPDGTVQGVSGGTGMGHDLQHYHNIKVMPTAYGQGLTFLMLTEMQRDLVKA